MPAGVMGVLSAAGELSFITGIHILGGRIVKCRLTKRRGGGCGNRAVD